MKSEYRNIAVLFLVVALLGFIDATYLSVEHFLGQIPPCTSGGCEFVLTSSYSAIWGIPVALLGVLYYFTVLILSIAFLDTKKSIILKRSAQISVIGFLGSIYFVYLQLFVINHICKYCMVSAFTCTALFIIGIYTFYKLKKAKNNQSGIDSEA